VLALARPEVADVVVLGESGHELGDPIAESGLDLVRRHLRVLDDVVEQRGGDDLVAEPGIVEQTGHRDRMGDVRRPVVLAQLPLVSIGCQPMGGADEVRSDRESRLLTELRGRPRYHDDDSLIRPSC